MRKNNIEDMDVTEILTLVKEEICDSVCKYQEGFDKNQITKDELDIMCANCCTRRIKR